MLTIATDTLPQTFLSYIAFRVSFLETLERIGLARQFSPGPADGFGYLTEVPFFQGVPPHVQLDLLASTWSRHIAPAPTPASLVDEAVIYAACETGARIVEQDPTFLQRVIKAGPIDLELAVDGQLAVQLRGLHLTLSNEGDFLMISQFEDMPPETASRLKRQFHLDETRLEQMFDVLERWHITDDLLYRLTGLLADREIRRTARMLEMAQPVW